jgi:hypothetical protein
MPRFAEKSKTEPRRWFRFYAESIDDPKVQRLAPHLFKTWVNLLSLACQTGGTLPSRSDIAFRLRLSDHDAQQQLDELIGLGLLDITGTNELEPHNWKGRQFISDSSVERVRKHRKQKQETACNVTCNDAVTPPDTETDTEADTEPPKVPQGDDDGNAVAKPIDLKTAFRPADENEGVIHTEAGTVRLVNGIRSYWLDQFGGNEQRLDLALRQVSIQPQSRTPIRSQVERQLARIASEKLDRDQRYQAAAAANKPASQPRKLSRW